MPDTEFEFLPFLRSPGCALLFTICSFMGGCVWVIVDSGSIHELATFDCGKDRSIVFLKSNECDQSQPIYYEVRVSGQTIVPLTQCSDVICSHGEVLLDIRLAADGEVVGLFHPSESGNVYWVVHDFRDGASWPRGDTKPEFRGSGRFTQKDLEDLLNNAARKNH